MAKNEPDRTWTAIPRLGASQTRHAFLVVLSGPQLGEVFPLEPGRDLCIGRREDADVAIRDEGVSRRHATVRVEGEGALLRDLGSVNGTYVDGTRASEARLVNGTRVHVGSATTLKFTWADELEARYQLRLAEGALTDPLTGVFNRRHFEERLAAELAAAHRHGRAVSLLLVDVDHFKAVNDRLGHLAGDEALKVVALVLRGAIRKEDVLARFGGEEFVVIARETALEGGRALAERIRCAMERSRCMWEREEIGLTVSVGVAVSDTAGEFVAGRTDRALLDAADRALYAAKQGGRNRVVATGPAAVPTRGTGG